MRDKHIPKRVAATLIDYTIVFAFFILFVYACGAPGEGGGRTISGLPSLIPVVFWFVYIVLAEWYFGGTVGHQIFQLRIASANGNAVSLGQTILRRLCDALEISLCFGLVAYLLVWNTENGQRLGDLVAKTLVVGIKDHMEDPHFDFEKA